MSEMDPSMEALEAWAGNGWSWFYSGGGIWLLEKKEKGEIPGIEGECYFFLSPSEEREGAADLGAYSVSDDSQVAYLTGARMGETSISDCLERIKEPAFRLSGAGAS